MLCEVFHKFLKKFQPTSRKRRHQEVEQLENTVLSEIAYSKADDVSRKKKKKNPKAGKSDGKTEKSQQRGKQDDIITQGRNILESSKSLIRNISNQHRVGDSMQNLPDKSLSSQKRNVKKHKGNKMDDIIPPKQFKAFDFSAVDFGRFQGGSHATGSVDTKQIKVSYRI